MAGLASSTSTTVTSRKPLEAKSFAIAAGPILLLLLAMGGLRLLPKEGDEATPEVAPRHTPVRFTAVDASTQAALVKVTSGQLTAFQRSDFATALKWSLPSYQDHMPLNRFRVLIQEGYPSLMKAVRTEFKTASTVGNMAILPLSVYDAKGRESRFNYQLQREDSTWYVIGCAPLFPSMSLPPGQTPVADHVKMQKRERLDASMGIIPTAINRQSQPALQ